MKDFRFVLLAIALFSFTNLMAQPKQGDLLIGGNAGFDIRFSDDDDNVFTINLNPNIASMISDRVAIGGSMGLSYTKEGDFSFTSLSLLPLVRTYFPGSGNTTFFISASAGLSLVSASFSGTSNSESAFTFAVGPGMALFVSEDISIDFSLSYFRIGGEFDQSNLLFNIGVQAYLLGDKE